MNLRVPKIAGNLSSGFTTETGSTTTRPNAYLIKEETKKQEGVSLSLDVEATLGCHFHKATSLFMLTIEEQYETANRGAGMKF
jgi:hypothetical protein